MSDQSIRLFTVFSSNPVRAGIQDCRPNKSLNTKVFSGFNFLMISKPFFER